ncbi:unnamed protein product [Mytilus coruscus]|uniref:Reverse transcriptase domain-containing protein n=1 Tax=Mytilus coruscus TaxID=42192 RepID=A0A6J8DVH3_MYTCO|nr:unnamed protein product [Mytilus coruscus]
MVNNDIETFTDIFSSVREPIQEVTDYELNKCILSFKNGKAPDIDKFTIGHLKYGGHIVINILTKLINLIFKTVVVPNNLKTGIGCPLFKNGGKSKEDPSSYRRITITSAIGKTIKKLHLSRNKSSIKNRQTGQLPIESEIHKKMLSLYRNIADNHGSVERSIAESQLALKTRDSESWFIQILELTELYDLPSPIEILDLVPEKHIWKKLVYNAVNDYWKNSLILEARTKVTMKLFNFENFNVGVVHNIWKSSGSELLSVKRAGVKSKILSGTYTIQADRAKFNGNRTSSLCPLCFKHPEDLIMALYIKM